MGSSFFKGNKPPTMNVGNQGQEARAIGAGQYATRAAGAAAQKNIGAAQAINNAAIKAHGPLKGSAAYPKGPKI
jgi:hypothetical protein